MTWLQGNTREATFLARRKPHAQQQGEQVDEGEERDGKQMMNMSTTAPTTYTSTPPTPTPRPCAPPYLPLTPTGRSRLLLWLLLQ